MIRAKRATIFKGKSFSLRHYHNRVFDLTPQKQQNVELITWMIKELGGKLIEEPIDSDYIVFENEQVSTDMKVFGGNK